MAKVTVTLGYLNCLKTVFDPEPDQVYVIGAYGVSCRNWQPIFQPVAAATGVEYWEVRPERSPNGDPRPAQLRLGQVLFSSSLSPGAQLTISLCFIARQRRTPGLTADIAARYAEEMKRLILTKPSRTLINPIIPTGDRIIGASLWTVTADETGRDFLPIKDFNPFASTMPAFRAPENPLILAMNGFGSEYQANVSMVRSRGE